MKSIELFSGAGGLALGLESAGFDHLALIERDKHACNTIAHNATQGHPSAKKWRLTSDDVRNISYPDINATVDLVAGGPPCQPFSLGGKHKAFNDDRDMFPEAVRAVRELQPKSFIFENVKGLTRQTFASYFEYIKLQLSHPGITRKPAESWYDHLSNLERVHTSGTPNGLSYNVVARLLNAADYGVPQNRYRVFIVGFRSDLNIEWSFPKPTHSIDKLLIDKWVNESYWDNHKIAKRLRPDCPDRLKNRIRRLTSDIIVNSDEMQRCRTLRDAISDLPAPSSKNSKILNHSFRTGAKAYPGHTGSQLDEPAKALKAGDHGVPGGENMIAFGDGSYRYFSVRESARIQTFPDDYEILGSWSESMRQLGNAVPVKLANIVGRSVYHQLVNSVGQ